MSSLEALAGTTNAPLVVIDGALVESLNGLRGLRAVDALGFLLENVTSLTALAGLPGLSATADVAIDSCNNLVALTDDVVTLGSLRLAACSRAARREMASE